MAVDQAAGLRRRNTRLPVRGIHCYFDQAGLSTQLAQALRQLGLVSLLVDMCGRLFDNSPARSLFDWKQQLERGQLNTLPQAYGEGWFAPGFQVETPGFHKAVQAYDCVVFDAGPVDKEWAGLADTTSQIVIGVQPLGDSIQAAYALLKTLSHRGHQSSIGLVGDAAACGHLRAACCRFLEQSFSQTVFSVAHEDDAFAALAIRMADEETRRLTRCK